jgi:hypothetical protein
MKEDKLAITTNLNMPQDFDVDSYNAVHKCLRSKITLNNDVWGYYAGGWNAIMYRFLTVDESDKKFTGSINKSGGTPVPCERYIQERELFSFFVNGLATIESFCFAIYAIGSLVEPSAFSMSTERKRRNINPENTVRKFKKRYPNEQVTKELQKLVESDEFECWKEIRNVLAHRLSPGREVSVNLSFGGGNFQKSVTWNKVISIDENTTKIRRQWLANTLNRLLLAAKNFVFMQFP